MTEESTGAWMARTGVADWILKVERERKRGTYPCDNADSGCTNTVAHPHDLCPACFEAEGDEPTVRESWEQEGAWHGLCQHGRPLEDCLRCNPVDW